MAEYITVLIIFIIILAVWVLLDIFALLRVPVKAQQKGYNVYAWIGLAWFLGIISYFILKGLSYNNFSVKNESVSLNNGVNCSNKVLNATNISNYTSARNIASNSVKKVSYSAWICPKCGEKNNYAAKNCINCFEPRP